MLRAGLDGVVTYGAMTAAAILLLALKTPDRRALSAVGGAAALVYLRANFAARRAYLDALVEGIRSGRLGLGDLDHDILQRGAGRLAGLLDPPVRAESAPGARSRAARRTRRCAARSRIATRRCGSRRSKRCQAKRPGISRRCSAIPTRTCARPPPRARQRPRTTSPGCSRARIPASRPPRSRS